MYSSYFIAKEFPSFAVKKKMYIQSPESVKTIFNKTNLELNNLKLSVTYRCFSYSFLE